MRPKRKLNSDTCSRSNGSRCYNRPTVFSNSFQMVTTNHQLWHLVSENARKMLDDPRLLPDDLRGRHFEPTLHLWVSPTFTPEKHWIYSLPRPNLQPKPKPIVQQIVWQREIDLQRIMAAELDPQIEISLDPTFEIKTTEIELDIYRRMRDKLGSCKLAPFLEHDSVGRDGDLMGIETLDIFYAGRITWWSDPPEEWSEIIDWFESQVKFFDSVF